MDRLIPRFYGGALALAALLAACSGGDGELDEDAGSPPPDASASDAAVPDAGDGGVVEDAGEAIDAGEVPDAGPTDAGASCAEGVTACAGACVDLQTDEAHCGACGVSCGDVPGAEERCEAGVCVLTCEAGRGDCDGDYASGCEVDLATTSAHCGECDNACDSGPASSPLCSSGRCALTCEVGFEDCDGDSGNGCEVDGRSDLDNCGGCDVRCASPPNATALCSGGDCGFTCVDGHGDCDGEPDNGCEVVFAADTSHCGGCGVACPAPPHTVPMCSGSSCGTVCEDGFEDCNGVAADGCEADLSGFDNCGTCGAACRRGQACFESVCHDPKRAFVTDGRWLGDLGGVAGADSKCQAEAEDASLGGSWLAWIADATTSPVERFARAAAGYVRLDGQVLSTSWSDTVDGNLAAPLSYTPTGVTLTGSSAWTGVFADGARGPGGGDCAGWTSSESGGVGGAAGLVDESDGLWTIWANQPCHLVPSSLYCFEQ